MLMFAFCVQNSSCLISICLWKRSLIEHRTCGMCVETITMKNQMQLYAAVVHE